MSTNPLRRRWRNRLFLIGILPAVLALLFAGKVGLMVSAQASGDSAYGKDDFAGAAKAFAGNATANFLEPWIAPFNEAAAKHRDEDFAAALTRYDVALDDVPGVEECTVRINMALSHEAIGDESLDKPDVAAALKAWRAGRDVLADGKCPTEAGGGEAQSMDAAAVDERLRQKIEEQDQAEPQDPKKKDQAKDTQESEKRKQQKEKLDKRNTRGQQERQQSKDYEDYRDAPSEPEYHW